MQRVFFLLTPLEIELSTVAAVSFLSGNQLCLNQGMQQISNEVNLAIFKEPL